MDYFLKICVPVLIIGAYVGSIETASTDRSCYYCRETNGGPCNDMINLLSVRCDSLVYSKMKNNENKLFYDDNSDNTGTQRSNDNDNNDNTDSYRGNGGNGGGQHGGELEPRSNSRPPVSGTKFRCVTERREHINDGINRNVLLRTCVLDHFADTYCEAVRTIGQTHIYDKYDLKACHICDSDNCNKINNFGISLQIPFVLIAIVSALTKLISM